MSRPEVLAVLQGQLAEIARLKAELTELSTELERGPPPELAELRQELDALNKEQEFLRQEELLIPEEFRVPPHYEHRDGQRRLFPGQKLFPPPSTEEAKTGRVVALPKSERVIHPLPWERPQDGGPPPIVTRVTWTASLHK
jgi:hypothetical protein